MYRPYILLEISPYISDVSKISYLWYGTRRMHRIEIRKTLDISQSLAEPETEKK